MLNGDSSGVGTLLVKDRTHTEHAHFFETASSLSKEQQAAVPDFYIFKPEEVPHWDPFQTLPLAAKAGSVFLWDSRTVHAVRSPSQYIYDTYLYLYLYIYIYVYIILM